ncbi:MAG: polyprenyl synthetase family protein [Betaproteobacteria bacterium]|nr:polyprenyl synthetase family protein [Betaproteobacteria bacterium]
MLRRVKCQDRFPVRKGSRQLDTRIARFLRFPFSSGPPVLSIDVIRTLLAEDLRAVDDVVRARLHSDVALIRQVSEYIIGSGGKRLRPVLLLLAAGSCGYRGPHAHQLAAVVEFIHTATLLHDDVVDESDMRRGRTTANSVFGNPASVLVGDFLYSRSFQMMVSVGRPRVMEVLSDATNVIAEGEVMQLMNVHDPDITEDAYLGVIRYKTAKLFEAAGRLGAVLADASDTVESDLARFGMHLGTAFQVIDDVLDYSGETAETGKNLGDDLAEGKTTLPLIHVLRSGTRDEAALVRKAIAEGGLAEFGPVMAAITRTRALEYARNAARAEIDRAVAMLDRIESSPYKESLLHLAAFSVTRSQ